MTGYDFIGSAPHNDALGETDGFLRVRVFLDDEDGGRAYCYATGATADDAVASAETFANSNHHGEPTGTYAMSEWEAAPLLFA